MSSVNHGPEHISGPLYVTSEVSKPNPIKDPTGRPITGAAYIQGPCQIGKDSDFLTRWATLMVVSVSTLQTRNIKWLSKDNIKFSLLDLLSSLGLPGLRQVTGPCRALQCKPHVNS